MAKKKSFDDMMNEIRGNAEEQQARNDQIRKPVSNTKGNRITKATKSVTYDNISNYLELLASNITGHNGRQQAEIGSGWKNQVGPTSRTRDTSNAKEYRQDRGSSYTGLKSDSQKEFYQKGFEKSAKQNKSEVRKMSDAYHAKAQAYDQAANDGLNSKQKFAMGLYSNLLNMGEDAIIGGGNMLMGMGLTSYGQSSRDARNSGASETRQKLAGLSNAGIQVGTELLGGGLIGPMRKLTGTTGLLDSAGEKIAYKLANKAAGLSVIKKMVNDGANGEAVYKAIRNMSRGAVGMTGEGLEEVAADLLQPLSNSLYNHVSVAGNYKKDVMSAEGLKQMGLDFAGGAAAAGILGGSAHLAGKAVNKVAGVDPEKESYTDEEKNSIINSALKQGEDTDAYKYAETLKAQADSDGHIYDTQIDELAFKTFKQNMDVARQIDKESRQAEAVQRQQMKSVVGDVSRYQTQKREKTVSDEIDNVMYSNVLKTADEASQALKSYGASTDQIVSDSMAIARIVNGTGTAMDVAALSVQNAPARAVLSSMTGITLPATNTETRKTLTGLIASKSVITKDQVQQQAKENVRNKIKAIGESFPPEIQSIFDQGVNKLDNLDNGLKYTVAFSEVFDAGRNGESYSSVETKYNDLMPMTVKAAIFKQGQMEAERENQTIEESKSNVKTVKNKAEGKLTIDKDVDEVWIKENKDTIDALSKAAKNLRTDIWIKKQIDNGELKDVANGYYDNGTIYLSASSTQPLMSVLKHELTHRIRDLSPAEYKELKDFLVQHYYKDDAEGYENRINEIVTDYSKGGRKLSRTEAEEEFVANSADIFLTDEQAIQNLIEENRTLGEKIYSIIKDMLEAIKDIVVGKNSRYYGQWMKDQGIVEQAEQIWFKGLYGTIDKELEYNESIDRFELRKVAPPQNTMIGYKAFKVKNGKLYPPMVENPKGYGTPGGVWLDADSGVPDMDADGNIKMNQMGRAKVTSKGNTLAWRPGWHLGPVPDATQFNVDPKAQKWAGWLKKRGVTAGESSHKKNGSEKGPTIFLNPDIVFARVEFAADNDYQMEAYEYGMKSNGKFSHALAGIPYTIKDGYYRYRTNAIDKNSFPWYISGSMIIKDILTDEECRQICKENGIEMMPRLGGDFRFEEHKIKPGPVSKPSDLTPYEKGQDYSEEVMKLPGYKRRPLNFNDSELKAAFLTDKINDRKNAYIKNYEFNAKSTKSRFAMKNSSYIADRKKQLAISDEQMSIKFNMTDSGIEIAKESLDDLAAASYTGSDNETKLVALGFTRSLIKDGSTSILGRKVNSTAEMAEIAQVFRDPRFETMRYIFLNADNKVVFQTGITCRLPSTSQTFDGDMSKFFPSLMRAAASRGATSIYMLHNHPSGTPKPSAADVSATNTLSKYFKKCGLEFNGHVIINHNKFGCIDGDLKISITDLSKGAKDMIMTPEIKHPLLNKKITSYTSLAEAAKSVQVSDDISTAIYVSSLGEVRAISEFSNKLKDKSKWIKESMVELGGSTVYISTSSLEVRKEMNRIMGMDGTIVDVIYFVDEDYAVSSRQNDAIQGTMNFNEYPAKRVGPDTRFSMKDSSDRQLGKYTIREYNKYGWAINNGLLTEKELSNLFDKISDKHLGTQFTKNQDGLFIIPVGDEFGINNKLIYTNGNYYDPSIEQVVTINLHTETKIDMIRRSILYEEANGWEPIWYSDRINTDYSENELISRYSATDYRLPGGSTGREKGRKGERINKGNKWENGGTNNKGNNRRKYCLKNSPNGDEDSKGRKLTDGQKKKYADSMALDRDGRLASLYHATSNGGFTVFDPKESDDKRSLFFTNDIEVAATYNDTDEIFDLSGDDMGDEGNYEVYLNLKNPMIIEGNGQHWNYISTGDDQGKWIDYISLNYIKGFGKFGNTYSFEIGADYDDDSISTEDRNEAIEFLTGYGFSESAAEDAVTKAEENSGYSIENFSLDSKGNLPEGHNTRYWAEYAQNNGYDGVIFRDIVDIGEYGDPDIQGASDIYIAFSPEQVKSVDNENPTDDPDIRFSMKQPVETNKNLIAVHNIRESELLKSIKLGGLPMPSIAIIKDDYDHNEYGDISLIFDKDTIDPAKSSNKVYGGDAWTPIYPHLEYEVNDSRLNDYSNKFYELERKGLIRSEFRSTPYNLVSDMDGRLERYGGEAGLIEYLKTDTAMKNMFLADTTGHPIDLIHKTETTEISDNEKELSQYFIDNAPNLMKSFEDQMSINPVAWPSWAKNNKPEIIKVYSKYLAENGLKKSEIDKLVESMNGYSLGLLIRHALNYKSNGGITTKEVTDTEGTYDKINNAVDQNEYEKWLEKLLSGIEKSSGIRKPNVDTFTSSGNRKSFKTLHYEENLENVVKVMKGQENGDTLFSAMGIWGVSAKDYKSIKEIKSDSSRLTHADPDTYKKYKEEYGERLSKIANKIKDKRQDNEFIALDNAMATIIDAVRISKSEASISSYIKKWSNASDPAGIAKEIVSLVNDIANMPTEYFEAKPKRAVELSEIKAAVIPETASDTLKQLLDSNDIDYLTYGENDRLEKVNQAAAEYDLKFQMKSDKDKLLNQKNKEIENLNEKIAFLKAETRLTKIPVPEEKVMNKKISEIIEDNLGHMDSALHGEIKKVFKEIYTELNKGEDMSTGMLYDLAEGAARMILSKYKMMHDSYEDNYESIKRDLKNRTLRIDSSYIGDFGGEKGFADFKRRNSKWFKLSTTEGYSVDEMYNDLAAEYPGLFDADTYTNEADQISNIASMMNDMEPWYETYSMRQQNELTPFVAKEILDAVYSTEPHQTYADKTKAKYDEMLQEQRETYKRKLAEKTEKYVSERNAVIQKHKDRIEARYKAKLNAVKKNNKDKTNRKYYTSRIEAYAEWMSHTLLEPADDRHIPEGYKKAIAEMLAGFDFSTKRSRAYTEKNGPSKRTMRFIALSNAYSETIKADDSPLEPDEEMADQLKLLAEAMDGRRFEDLNLDELADVYHIIKKIRYSLSTINRAFSEGIKQNIAELGDAVIAEAATHSDKADKSGFIPEVMRFLNESNVNPSDMFAVMGGTENMLYQNMRNAFDKNIMNVDQIKQYVEGLGSKYAIKEWENNGRAESFTVSSGETIELQPVQIMSLYCLSKRQQALTHLLGSGIVASPMQTFAGKRQEIMKGVYSKNLSQNKVRVTYEDLQKIISTLSREQRAAAEEIQDYLNTTCADWGNETSMRLYGYRKFTEQNYFPIKSADAFLNEMFDNRQPAKIKNVGFTKNTVVNANNPIVIDDIFNVLTQHATTMSMYNSLVPAITDFERVYNYKQMQDKIITASVQDSIRKAYGKSANAYIKRFMNDLNQNYTSISDHNLINFFLRKMKQGTLGLNLRVLVQQPTAIVRAGAVIDQKYLANPTNLGISINEMQEKSPIAKWKSWGFYNTDVSRDMKDIFMDNKSTADKIFMGAYGKADDIGWAWIWNAVKHEINATRKDLKPGSEDYWKAVNERFSYVIDRTQVVDSVFHRSQFMRNNDTMSKIVTSFMAEPTKTYNLLRTELLIAGHDFKAGKKASATKRVARVISVFMANAAAVSIVAALIDALRGADDDDKDKTFLEKWQKYSIQNIGQNVNPLTLLPMLRDVNSLFQGYDVTRLDMEGITNLVKAVTDWQNSKLSLYQKIKSTSKGISDVTGIPLYNVMRDGESIWEQTYKMVVSKSKTDYIKHRMYYSIDNKKNAAVFKRDFMAAKEAGDTEAAEKIKADMLEHGYKEKEITDYVNSKISEEYSSGIDKAIKSGDTGSITDAYENMVAAGYPEDKAKGKLKSALNSVYYDAIDESDYSTAKSVLSILRQYGFNTKNKFRSSLYSKYKDAMLAGKTNEAKKIIAIMRNNGVSEDYIEKTVIKGVKREMAVNELGKLLKAGNTSEAWRRAWNYHYKYGWETKSLIAGGYETYEK